MFLDMEVIGGSVRSDLLLSLVAPLTLYFDSVPILEWV